MPNFNLIGVYILMPVVKEAYNKFIAKVESGEFKRYFQDARPHQALRPTRHAWRSPRRSCHARCGLGVPVSGIIAQMLTKCTSERPGNRMQDVLVSHYWNGDAMRSRSVSDIVLSGLVDIPAPPARLAADWKREIALGSGLEPGDVETLPLARARVRWPDYRQCVGSVSDWVRSLGLRAALDTCGVALMACRGARYHHDGAQYGGAAFCNLFLSEDRGLDLHFSFTDRRIPLVRGTVVIFDTCQPHAVIARGSSGFDTADFPAQRDCTLQFLTWELPIDAADVGQALRITYDVDTPTPPPPGEAQLWLNGASASVCPDSGRWLQPGR